MVLGVGEDSGFSDHHLFLGRRDHFAIKRRVGRYPSIDHLGVCIASLRVGLISFFFGLLESWTSSSISVSLFFVRTLGFSHVVCAIEMHGYLWAFIPWLTAPRLRRRLVPVIFPPGLVEGRLLGVRCLANPQGSRGSLGRSGVDDAITRVKEDNVLMEKVGASI